MAEAEIEQTYLVPSHLRTQQTIAGFPSRLFFTLSYTTIFLGLPIAVSVFRSTNGLWLPAILSLLIPALVFSPFACWWLSPPAEHGLFAFLGFLTRSFGKRSLPAPGLVAVYRMPTINLESASTAQLRQARAQWGALLNGTTHPLKIIILGRPLTTLPIVQGLLDHPNPMAQQLGTWFELHLATTRLVDRERLLVVPAKDPAELSFRTEILQKTFRQTKLHAVRIPENELPALRARCLLMGTDASIHEGSSEMLVDGWWTRAYAVGRMPSAISTNWASPLFAGDEPCDIILDIQPQDVWSTNFSLDARINQLTTSSMSVARRVALENLVILRESFERRTVAPFELGMTIIVRDATPDAVRARGERIVERARNLAGTKLNLLRWEQTAGLLQADPTLSRPMNRRTHLIETGTLARTYPWSDGTLQIEGGIPWGDAGSRPCLFTPYNPRARGHHMALYGTTNAGKGMAAHLLWSRLFWAQGVRIFGIDQDEQHEHCGRFLEYLGGRVERPRDDTDAAEIQLHPDDGAVMLDLSEIDEIMAGKIFAAWAEVVKRHMLTHPGRSIFFVDEAVTISEDLAGARALRQSFQRARHWGQSSHVMTQRVSDWFDTRVGRAIQGNCDAWWCGGQQPREMDEVAKALRLSETERDQIERAGIGTGLLVSNERRVWLDLFEKMSPAEYAAMNTDPIILPVQPAAILERKAA